MNSALFIRRRSVLALWVLTPFAVIAGVLIISRSLLERENIRLMQDRELARLIPAMEEALAGFDRFASDYRPESEARLSMENRHISLLNAAAAECGDFSITSISLDQDPAGTPPPGMIRISLFVKGSGSQRGITSFLNNVRSKDRMLYEKRILIMPEKSQSGVTLLEAEFGKIYFDKETCNETSIQN